MAYRLDSHKGAAQYVGAAGAGGYTGDACLRRFQQRGLHGLETVNGAQMGGANVV